MAGEAKRPVANRIERGAMVRVIGHNRTERRRWYRPERRVRVA